MHKTLVYAQDSCVCTALLCMHNTLVHALEGAGTKAGTQQKSAVGLARGGVLFCAQNLVHAHEACACTRILGLRTNPCC